MLVLDSGAVSRLSRRSPDVAAVIRVLDAEGWWPPVVPSIVLAECLTGHPGRDANANRLLKTCHIREDLPESIARRAAALRYRAGRGSAVDAIVVASADPEGRVLTQDVEDLRALAAHASGVSVRAI